ncbi:MAG: hypothetical protein KJ847_02785 [Firmicutes bacterium]|nr:hypothetical protein [Bacillota bacterium]
MDTPLFFSLIGKTVKVTLAEYAAMPDERSYQGKVMQTNGKFVKMNVNGKIVYLRIRYVVFVEEI